MAAIENEEHEHGDDCIMCICRAPELLDYSHTKLAECKDQLHNNFGHFKDRDGKTSTKSEEKIASELPPPKIEPINLEEHYKLIDYSHSKFSEFKDHVRNNFGHFRDRALSINRDEKVFSEESSDAELIPPSKIESIKVEDSCEHLVKVPLKVGALNAITYMATASSQVQPEDFFDKKEIWTQSEIEEIKEEIKTATASSQVGTDDLLKKKDIFTQSEIEDIKVEIKAEIQTASSSSQVGTNDLLKKSDISTQSEIEEIKVEIKEVIQTATSSSQVGIGDFLSKKTNIATQSEREDLDDEITQMIMFGNLTSTLSRPEQELIRDFIELTYPMNDKAKTPLNEFSNILSSTNTMKEIDNMKRFVERSLSSEPGDQKRLIDELGLLSRSTRYKENEKLKHVNDILSKKCGTDEKLVYELMSDMLLPKENTLEKSLKKQRTFKTLCDIMLQPMDRDKKIIFDTIMDNLNYGDICTDENQWIKEALKNLPIRDEVSKLSTKMEERELTQSEENGDDEITQFLKFGNLASTLSRPEQELIRDFIELTYPMNHMEKKPLNELNNILSSTNTMKEIDNMKRLVDRSLSSELGNQKRLIDELGLLSRSTNSKEKEKLEQVNDILLKKCSREQKLVHQIMGDMLLPKEDSLEKSLKKQRTFKTLCDIMLQPMDRDRKSILDAIMDNLKYGDICKDQWKKEIIKKLSKRDDDSQLSTNEEKLELTTEPNRLILWTKNLLRKSTRSVKGLFTLRKVALFLVLVALILTFRVVTWLKKSEKDDCFERSLHF